MIDLYRALVAATKGNFDPLKRVALSRTPLVRVDLVRRGLGAVRRGE